MAIKFLKNNVEEKIISIHDDAIDREKCDLLSYQDNYDQSKLVFKDGCKPTFFVIKNIAGPDLVVIQQEHYKTVVPEIKPGMTPDQIKNLKITVQPVNQGEMINKYFLSGCKKIIDNDQETEMNAEIFSTVPPMIIQEIGSLVMMRSVLTDSKKK